MEFSARIRGDEIVCEIASETDLISPVFCFSMLAPARVVSGGTILSSVGGYCEAQLSDLAAGMSHTVTLAYADPRHRPKNRAWLPLGAYLRDRDGVTELPELRSGADPWEPGPAPDDDGLRLVPPPSSWEPGGDVVELTSVSADDARLETVHELAIRQGFGPFILSDGLPIEVRHDGRLGPEAYTLLVGSDKTVIHAADDAGRFLRRDHAVEPDFDPQGPGANRCDHRRTRFWLARPAFGLRAAFLSTRDVASIPRHDGVAETEQISLAFLRR